MITTEREWKWEMSDFRRWAEQAGHFQIPMLMENYRRFTDARREQKRPAKRAGS